MDSKQDDVAWLQSTFHAVPKPSLPDDCIEYSLYALDKSIETSDESETKLLLRDVLKTANDLRKQYLKDYLWQRQPFGLELVRENGEVCQETM